MNDETPSHASWARLYEAMNAVKELAPWQWMEEADLFGVRDPETGEVYNSASWALWVNIWPWPPTRALTA